MYLACCPCGNSHFLQAAWRRKAGVLRKTGKIEKAVEELSSMLDTFYTEVEGWLELADIYTSCQQYVVVHLC